MRIFSTEFAFPPTLQISIFPHIELEEQRRSSRETSFDNMRGKEKATRQFNYQFQDRAAFTTFGVTVRVRQQLTSRTTWLWWIDGSQSFIVVFRPGLHEIGCWPFSLRSAATIFFFCCSFLFLATWCNYFGTIEYEAENDCSRKKCQLVAYRLIAADGNNMP